MKKWLIARKLVQFFIILLFLSPLFLVEVAGTNFFYGTLSSSEIFGIQLSDPLGALSVTLASKKIVWGFLGSALIVFLFYLVISGRVFCSWVCPVNTLLELTDSLRKRFKKLPDVQFNLNIKIQIAVLVLVLSFFIGVPIFEIISPIGNTLRNLLFVWGIGSFILLAIVLFDFFVSKRGWCRYFCPVGGFYSSIGKAGQLRVKIDNEKCVSCMQCKKVCFSHPSILDPAINGDKTYVTSGDCSLCGACIDACSHEALSIGLRPYRQKEYQIEITNEVKGEKL
ncbi:quinol dehydrogenase ferredoxin subunit NapH [Anaerobacillus sp. CMMVII]|uniref:quinol dehydrogenase ferredoxin subunit NapH n=1 Tax=Anaerobacillus sp. CMMVII TaxID=2755588 RepID=UPI0021B73291|nr:quinol dehydrogenase ferredoxin subunit NapH [Anaerobacillus sp. CMMVII]MCT8138981.1 quinol dehydrogenase ferredoxin subunit NapH [Anaerobacillus sp. CMMVII]